VGHELEAAEEIDGHPRRNGSDLHPTLAEEPGYVAVERPEERAQERRQIAAGHAQIAPHGGAVDHAGDPVSEHAILLPLLRPQHLLDRAVEGAEARLHGGTGLALPHAVAL